MGPAPTAVRRRKTDDFSLPNTTDLLDLEMEPEIELEDLKGSATGWSSPEYRKAFYNRSGKPTNEKKDKYKYGNRNGNNLVLLI